MLALTPLGICVDYSIMTLPAAKRRSIRVLLLGQQKIVLAGLRLLLEREAGFTVMDDTTGGPRADMVLLDVDGRSDDLLTVLSANLPRGSRIVILGSELNADTLGVALRHGVTGALLKKASPRVLLEALRAVADGEVWLDQAATAHLVAALSADPPTVSREARRLERLTPREREVVALIGQGLPNQGIAGKLHISQVTVRNHLTSVFRKLKVNGRFQLALYALAHGLSKAPPKLASSRRVPVRATSQRRRTAS